MDYRNWSFIKFWRSWNWPFAELDIFLRNYPDVDWNSIQAMGYCGFGALFL
jgi:hypothetical protein